jgi:hypothetical protein
MLVLALAVVVVPLGWLAARRTARMDPALRRAVLAFAISCLAVALVLRAGPAAGLLVVAALAAWLSMRGSGGDGRDDDGRGPPDGPGPDPDPGDQASLHPEPLDHEAFDAARAAWEHELPKRS